MNTQKTTIFYNRADDLDIMITLLFFEELELFFDRIIGSEQPLNNFVEVSLL